MIEAAEENEIAGSVDYSSVEKFRNTFTANAERQTVNVNL